MKTRFPIYSKLLFWFFINLIALATAGWLVLRGQFRFSIFSESSVIARVAQVADRFVKELPLEPGPRWAAVTEAYSAKYGVVFYCYDGQGRMVTGPTAPLPPVVHSQISPGPRRGNAGPGGPNGGGGRPPRDDDFPPGPPQNGGPDDRPPREFDPGFRPRVNSAPPRATGSPPLVSRFVVESSSPHRYWVGIRFETMFDGERPGYVLTASHSPTGNGLYFDVKPFVWAGLGVLALSALIWFPFVHSLTRSVKFMRDATGRLAEGDFAARVEDARRDELGELGEGINRMAVRLKGYVEGQKRFMSDIAHELCAPTARLQMSVGILEQRSPESERARLADVREEVEHMSALVNELLHFSKASIASQQVQLRPVAIREIAEKAAHREAATASQIAIDIDEGALAIAEPELLQRALGNLIRNAIRYAGHAGIISITAKAEGELIRICVSDEGPGIPADALGKIFDPFYRLDVARTTESGGAGLGLAIVKTCVESCGGTVSATNREPTGLAVTISLNRGDA